MKKKSLFVLGPITPLASDLDPFSQCLGFLNPNFDINWYDPLVKMTECSKKEFMASWHKTLAEQSSHYDAFIGFSFGAVILQHSLNVFQNQAKPIILISCPCIIDTPLREKLIKVLAALHNEGPQQAVKVLYSFVDPTYTYDWSAIESSQANMIAQRLTYGFSMELAHQPPDPMSSSALVYHQIIGEHSNLVTAKNLVSSSHCQIHTIAHAGMRMWTENPQEWQSLVQNCLTQGH